jgi:beta-lactamase class A
MSRLRLMRAAVAVLAVSAAITAAFALPPAAGAHRGAGTRKPHAAECDVPGADATIDQLWRPDMRAAIAYAHRRVGDIAFAVRTDERFYGYRPDHVEWSASVVKAMLMVAYLDEPSVADRPIDAYDNSLLAPMITLSDNNAADRVDEIVGSAGLDALARRVGMTRFAAAAPIWGETQITARDQTLLFLHIDRYIVARHRRYGMHLLASVVPSERWGIGEVAPPGWTLYFKGGWGYGTGLLDHQVVLLKRECARVAIAVLTMYDGSHAYGKQTLYGLFSRLLKRFPTTTTRLRHRGAVRSG